MMTQKQNMITEDYVSFEVAKLLKDKGFNEPCETSYYTSVSIGDFTKVRPYRDDLIAAPTHQMAIKWLRVVHDVDIEIQANVGMLGVKVYMPYISTYTPYKLDDVDIECGLTEDDVKGRVRQKKRNTRISNKTELIPAHEGFNTYEEAVEVALKYSLEKLI